MESNPSSAIVKPKIPPKPEVLAIKWDKIPLELVALAQWVVSLLEWNGTKWDKPPYDARYPHTKASTISPATWVSFDVAKKKCRGDFTLLGFVPTAKDHICVIDLDGCIDANGKIHPYALKLVRFFNSYTEYSPSGRGLRIFILDSTGIHKKSKWETVPWSVWNKKTEVEIWSERQYATVTGQVFENYAKIIERPGALLECWNAHDFSGKDAPSNNGRAKKGEQSNNGHKWKRSRTMDDAEILDLIRKSKRKDEFFALHARGVGSTEDKSVLDFNYFCTLRYWSQDAEQNRRIHAGSKLYRDKTDERRNGTTYIEETIQNAFAGITTTYQGRKPKKEIPPVERDEGTGRATINIHQHHRELSKCIHDELVKDPNAFQRNGELARIIHCVDEDGTSHRIQNANRAVLHDMIVQKMDFANSEGNPVAVPDNVIRLVATSAWREEDPPYRPIKKINTCPSLRSDGTAIEDSGYDEQSHIWSEFPDNLRVDIPTSPTQKDGIAAAKWLLDLFHEFPFVDEASRTHLIVLLLTLVCKELIPGLIPLFIIDANNQSAGKTLLCVCVYEIATGSDKPYTMHQGNESQMRADLITALRSGFHFLVYGNLDPDKVFRSKVLSDTLTSGAIYDRKYLTNDEYLFAKNEAQIVANGNNVQVDTDIMDRSIWIQLCAEEEHPEDRDPKTFKVYKEHKMHLKDYCRVHRSEILSKVLTVAMSYLAAENKPKGQHWGKFPEWAEVIGSMAEFVGLKDFRGNTEALRKTKNVEKSEIARFLFEVLSAQDISVVDDKIIGTPFTVRQFAETRLADNDNESTQQLVDVLPYKVADAKDRNQALGMLFNRIKGTPFYGYVVRQLDDDPHIHKPQYQIEAPQKDFDKKKIERSKKNAETLARISAETKAAKSKF